MSTNGTLARHQANVSIYIYVYVEDEVAKVGKESLFSATTDKTGATRRFIAKTLQNRRRAGRMGGGGGGNRDAFGCEMQ